MAVAQANRLSSDAGIVVAGDLSPPEVIDARQRLERICIVLLGAHQANYNADFAGIIRWRRRVLFAN